MRRTDRAQAFYRKKSNVRQLQNVLLSYAMYNFDLGYVQARCKISLFALLALVQVKVYVFNEPGVVLGHVQMHGKQASYQRVDKPDYPAYWSVLTCMRA